MLEKYAKDIILAKFDTHSYQYCTETQNCKLLMVGWMETQTSMPHRATTTPLSNTHILREVLKIGECYSMDHLSTFAVVYRSIVCSLGMSVSKIWFKVDATPCVLI